MEKGKRKRKKLYHVNALKIFFLWSRAIVYEYAYFKKISIISRYSTRIRHSALLKKRLVSQTDKPSYKREERQERDHGFNIGRRKNERKILL